jgi:hypothetical protein
MIRGVLLAAVVVVASVAGAGVVSADENESPVAAAGLDQTVSAGTVVYLDAGGSFDPDGSIESYRWEVTAPNGTTRSPACGSCAQTSFQANQSGEYTVTVTVSDDDGTTASDTLYVTAETSEPPTVSVTAPAAVQNGTVASFNGTVTAGDSELDRLVWSLNGRVIARQSLSGTNAERELRSTIDTTGPQTVRVRAVDIDGASSSDTDTFSSESRPSVSELSGSEPSSGPSDSGSPSGDGNTVTSMIDRIGNGGDYYMFLNPDGSFRAGTNSDATLRPKEVQRLADNTGVKYGEVSINTGPTNALIIDNPRIKEALDKDTGKLSWGVKDDGLESTNAHSSYDYQPKWEQSSPGVNWDKVDTRVKGTHTTSSPVSKDDWQLERSYTVPTGDTYRSSYKRGAYDEKIGTHTTTSSSWKSSPTGGEVVDTRRSVSHYTYEVIKTDREKVKVGKKKIGESPTWGWKEKTVRKTVSYCSDYMTNPWGGEPLCVDRSEYSYYTTETVWGRTGTEPIYTAEYEWQTTTTTVDKRSTSYPSDGQNVQAHYDTEYKVQTSDTTPVWQEYDKKYEYNEYEYKYVYDG